jgi:hypothetical protein
MAYSSQLRGAVMALSGDRTPPGVCRARRHWNSPSYRAAAGNIPFATFVPHRWRTSGKADHGAEGSRTPDLCSAIAALSQLSYSPEALLAT